MTVIHPAEALDRRSNNWVRSWSTPDRGTIVTADDITVVRPRGRRR